MFIATPGPSGLSLSLMPSNQLQLGLQDSKWQPPFLVEEACLCWWLDMCVCGWGECVWGGIAHLRLGLSELLSQQ